MIIWTLKIKWQPSKVKEQEICQAQQAYEAAKEEIARLSVDRQKEVLTEIEQHQQELTSLNGQLTQAEEQRKRETLAAPINGTVYNVKVVKSGATGQSGEKLLSCYMTMNLSGECSYLTVKLHQQKTIVNRLMNRMLCERKMT